MGCFQIFFKKLIFNHSYKSLVDQVKFKQNLIRYHKWLFGLTLSLIITSCSLPEHMMIRSSVDPRYQDDDVRFRTTYYFRVFDTCTYEGKDKDIEYSGPFLIKPKGAKKIVHDSLYRFRMTGKSNSLFSTVHFESGSLHKSEIDPFGARIVFDKASGRFNFESKQVKPIFNKNNTSLSASIKAEKPNNSRCSNGNHSQRGYQVLGPEGWRTFNQDERLVLAMSSNGEPLISAMKEIAGRMLNEQSTKTEVIFPLVKESLLVVQIQKKIKLMELGQPKSGEDVLKKIIETFN